MTTGPSLHMKGTLTEVGYVGIMVVSKHKGGSVNGDKIFVKSCVLICHRN